MSYFIYHVSLHVPLLTSPEATLLSARSADSTVDEAAPPSPSRGTHPEVAALALERRPVAPALRPNSHPGPSSGSDMGPVVPLGWWLDSDTSQTRRWNPRSAARRREAGLGSAGTSVVTRKRARRVVSWRGGRRPRRSSWRQRGLEWEGSDQIRRWSFDVVCGSRGITRS
jgi:hypothetical protein